MPTRANQTIVRNISGHDGKYFSFLGEHGATLDDGDFLAIPGNLFEQFSKDSIQRAALKYALDEHELMICSTPDVFVTDTVTFKPYRLGSTSGSAVVLDPDYGSYVGSNIEPDPPNNP